MLVKQLRKAEWRYEKACMDGKVDPLLELIERNWLNHYEKFFFMNNYGIILSENMPELRMTPEQIQRNEELRTAVSAPAPDAFDEPPMRDNIDEMPPVGTVIAVPQDTLGAASSSSAQDTTAPSLLPAGFVLYGRPWSMSCTFSPGNPADVLG